MFKRIYDKIYLTLRYKVIVPVFWLRKRFYECFLSRLDKPLMINVGGGIYFRPHWKVLDYVSPFYPFQRRYIEFDVDLLREGLNLPLKSDSVDFYYSAHTFEHIPQEFCPRLLSEIHRTLKPGGVARLNMPDYDKMLEAVRTNDAGYFAKIIARGYSIEEALIEQIATERLDNIDRNEIVRNLANMTAEEFADHYTQAASRDIQKEKGGNHINWFNFAKLNKMLRDAGFQTAYRSGPQQSQFKELRGEGGWLAIGNFFETKRMLGLDTTHPTHSLYVEAVK